MSTAYEPLYWFGTAVGCLVDTDTETETVGGLDAKRGTWIALKNQAAARLSRALAQAPQPLTLSPNGGKVFVATGPLMGVTVLRQAPGPVGPVFVRQRWMYWQDAPVFEIETPGKEIWHPYYRHRVVERTPRWDVLVDGWDGAVLWLDNLGWSLEIVELGPEWVQFQRTREVAIREFQPGFVFPAGVDEEAAARLDSLGVTGRAEETP